MSTNNINGSAESGFYYAVDVTMTAFTNPVQSDSKREVFKDADLRTAYNNAIAYAMGKEREMELRGQFAGKEFRAPGEPLSAAYSVTVYLVIEEEHYENTELPVYGESAEDMSEGIAEQEKLFQQVA